MGANATRAASRRWGGARSRADAARRDRPDENSKEARDWEYLPFLTEEVGFFAYIERSAVSRIGAPCRYAGRSPSAFPALLQSALSFAEGALSGRDDIRRPRLFACGREPQSCPGACERLVGSTDRRPRGGRSERATSYVAKRKAQIGDRVKPGDQHSTIVPLDHLWIEANLWENRMQRIRPGQSASVVAGYATPAGVSPLGRNSPIDETSEACQHAFTISQDVSTPMSCVERASSKRLCRRKQTIWLHADASRCCSSRADGRADNQRIHQTSTQSPRNLDKESLP
jgi:hypothetical protein